MKTATSSIPPSQEARSSSLTSPVSTDYAAPLAPSTAEPVGQPDETQASTQTGQQHTSPSTWSSQATHTLPIALRTVTGLSKWEGKILAIGDGFFTAELYPIDRDGMPMTADFDLELLGSDADGAVPGDVFYLSVRTVKSPGTRPTRTESLRLRRLGRITQKEVQDVYAKADALMEHLEQLFD